MSIACKYSGSFPDNSGYADSNRNFAMSLFISGIDITTEHIPQTNQQAYNGWIGVFCKAMEGRKIPYKIKIVHLTPDLYPKYMEDGIYHIGHLMWETDTLPKEWVDPCNKMQEIWTTTQDQVQAFKNSGVTVPVYCFPEPIDTSAENLDISPFIIPNFTGIRFYSIFQWIERKDPRSLLLTYWKTFEGKEDVMLILKTYKFSYSQSDFEKIEEDIEKWKKNLKLRHYPRVGLIQELYPQQDIWKLHKTGDIYVSSSHQEGWNRVAVEASLMGNPVISIGRSGFAEYFPKDIYYPVACAPAQVMEEQGIPWYKRNMNWYNIDPTDLSNTMQLCYDNFKEAKERGAKASEFVKDRFNFWVVGQQMKNRLEEINKIL